MILPASDDSNHSAVVRALTNREIKTSITTENMRSNDFTKIRSETPTVDMENTDVPAPPLHNLSRMSEENITDNCVRRQRAKTKDSVMPGIGLNNSTVEATRSVERKSNAEVVRNVKTTPSPKVSVNFSDIVSDLLETNKSSSSLIETSHPWLCINSTESPNSSNVLMEGCDSMAFSTQDKELVSLLQDLHKY